MADGARSTADVECPRLPGLQFEGAAQLLVARLRGHDVAAGREQRRRLRLAGAQDELLLVVAHLPEHVARDRCLLAFGVGTNLTNDVGPTPLQIVIKMIRCNGQPVAKLSDSPGKNMCEDPAYVAYLRQVFEIPATQGL